MADALDEIIRKHQSQSSPSTSFEPGAVSGDPFGDIIAKHSGTGTGDGTGGGSPAKFTKEQRSRNPKRAQYYTDLDKSNTPAGSTDVQGSATSRLVTPIVNAVVSPFKDVGNFLVNHEDWTRNNLSQSPDDSIFNTAASPAVGAVNKVRQGDYAGAGGDLLGGYGVPIATARVLGNPVARGGIKGAAEGAYHGMTDKVPYRGMQVPKPIVGAAVGSSATWPAGLAAGAMGHSPMLGSAIAMTGSAIGALAPIISGAIEGFKGGMKEAQAKARVGLTGDPLWGRMSPEEFPERKNPIQPVQDMPPVDVPEQTPRGAVPGGIEAQNKPVTPPPARRPVWQDVTIQGEEPPPVSTSAVATPTELPSGRKPGPAPVKPVEQPKARPPLWQGITDQPVESQPAASFEPINATQTPSGRKPGPAPVQPPEPPKSRRPVWQDITIQTPGETIPPRVSPTTSKIQSIKADKTPSGRKPGGYQTQLDQVNQASNATETAGQEGSTTPVPDQPAKTPAAKNANIDGKTDLQPVPAGSQIVTPTQTPWRISDSHRAIKAMRGAAITLDDARGLTPEQWGTASKALEINSPSPESIAQTISQWEKIESQKAGSRSQKTAAAPASGQPTQTPLIEKPPETPAAQTTSPDQLASHISPVGELTENVNALAQGNAHPIPLPQLWEKWKKAPGMTKEKFDRMILKGADEGKYSLQTHDHPLALDPNSPDFQGLVKDPTESSRGIQNYYVSALPR